VAKQWFYSHCGEKVIGPVTSRELKKLASSGELLPTDTVRRESAGTMIAARRVKNLFPPQTG